MRSRGERAVSWQRGLTTFLLFSSPVEKQSQPKSLHALYPLVQRADRLQSPGERASAPPGLGLPLISRRSPWYRT